MTGGHNRDVCLAQNVELGDLIYNLHVIFGFEKTKTNKQTKKIIFLVFVHTQ